MRHHSDHDTGFQKVSLWTSPDEAEFRVSGAVHAWWHRRRFLTGLAWDCIAAAALLRPAGPPASVLMLGLAGGTSLRILRRLVPGLSITAVEIDPGIITLAREHMSLDELEAAIHIDDAYAWIRRNQLQFDVVIDDVYRAAEDDVVRPGVYDPETGAALLRAIAPGGLLVANLVTGTGHRTLQSAFRRFFRENFSSVRSVTTPGGQNESLVGGQATLPPSALTRYHALWPDRRDQTYWQAISVASL